MYAAQPHIDLPAVCKFAKLVNSLFAECFIAYLYFMHASYYRYIRSNPYHLHNLLAGG